MPTEVIFKWVTYLPVDGRGHFLGSCELEGVDHSQDLIKIASCGGWIQQRKFEPFVRSNDKHLDEGGETDESQRFTWIRF